MSPSYAANDTEIYIVQGLPGKNLDVAIDGESVAEDVKTACGRSIQGRTRQQDGDLQRRWHDCPGKHLLDKGRVQGRYRRALAGFLIRRSFGHGVQVRRVKVPKGKAFLVVSHVAAVPPADVRVDETVLFENIANGESLELMVPVATYKVDIVPTKETEPVYFGPVSLTVKGGAINRVYALGDPEKKTMNVAVHVITAGTTGSGKPSEVNTGTGGQAVGDGDSWR